MPNETEKPVFDIAALAEFIQHFRGSANYSEPEALPEDVCKVLNTMKETSQFHDSIARELNKVLATIEALMRHHERTLKRATSKTAKSMVSAFSNGRDYKIEFSEERNRWEIFWEIPEPTTSEVGRC